MKKVLLLSVIALTSCGKFKFENRIQGAWTMKEARLESMDSWIETPAEVITITETHISNPWNADYTISGNTLILPTQIIKVDVKKKSMLMVFENNDSLRLVKN